MFSMGGSGLLHLSPRDNVCAATRELAAGEELVLEGAEIAICQAIPMGHKVAVRPIGRGEKVIKYGASIGSATQAIAVGEHVHTHNLESDYLPAAGREKRGS